MAGVVLIAAISWIIFLLFQAQGIYAGDSGDLATAAYLFGVPHPSGYPLYTFVSWVLTRLPGVSTAWLVALLSSLPQAITVALVAHLVYRVTKNIPCAVFSALVLVGNYVFFLYSVIVEVYALANLFMVLLLTTLLLWHDTKLRSWLYWTAFLFGLGLSHHHVVLFFPIVVAGWWLFARRSNGLSIWTPSLIFQLVGCVLLGLLPYVYVWFAAHGSSIINWDHATTVDRFIRLFMLADYGSFKANVGVGEHLMERLLGIKAYGQFVLSDFFLPGVILSIIGFVYLYRTKRSYFWLLLSAVVIYGPILFFYASFPLAGRFSLGTFEQFLLFTHTILGLVAGVGLFGTYMFTRSIRKVFRTRLSPRLTMIAAKGVVGILFLYPVIVVGMTLFRFWGFSNDMTAQNLGEDFLRTVKGPSMIFLYGDTPLFTTQYVRYVLGRRPETIVLHGNRVGTPEYIETLKSAFETLTYPQSTGQTFTREFISTHKDRYAIYTNSPFPVDGASFWVPMGLLYRLTDQTELPQLTTLWDDNLLLWQSYNTPQHGILSRFDHLLLSDVRDVYAGARINLGKTLLKGADIKHAQSVFTDALEYGSDTYEADAYLYLGIAEMRLNNCNAALDAFTRARKDAFNFEPSTWYYEAVTWRDCVKDPMRAEASFSEYERRKKATEQSLETL